MTSSGVKDNGYRDHGATRHEAVPEPPYGCIAPPPEDRGAGDIAGRVARYLFRIVSPRWEKYLAWPRNAFYASVLGTTNISVGSRNRFMGIDSIQIGRDFTALDYLWLHAVERDSVGKRYKPSLVIGNNVVVGYSVHIAATNCVRIGNDVLVGSRVIITDHNHGIYRGDTQSSPLERPADRLLTSNAEAIVEDNVWIGDGAIILPGAHIGTGSIIAANSVVNGTIPKYCTAAGIPAEPIKKYDWISNSWVRAY